MTRFYPFAVVVLLIIIGFISKGHSISKLKNRISETTEYHNDLVALINQFISTQKINSELYHKLMLQVNKMQFELGTDGIIAEMTDPLRGIRVRNYQMLVNIFQEMNSLLDLCDFLGHFNDISLQRFMSLANSCKDGFIRHIGRLNDLLQDEEEKRHNPFSCLAEGIKIVLWVPVYILVSFGLFNGKTYEKWRRKSFSGIVSAVIAIIGLFSAIITIVIGWEEFLSISRFFFVK